MADIKVRFSVQDQEVVRQALEKIGNDGQAALAKINAASQQPTTGLKFLSSIVEDLKSRLTGLAIPLGGFGQGLIQLGPAGFVAAAAIGATVAALSAISAAANEFADKASRLKDTSEVLHLTTSQLQALRQEGANFGLNSDQVATGLEKFTISVQRLREGGGELWDALSKINPTLRDQLAATKDTTAAYDLLGKAINSTTDASQRNALTRVALGRNSGAQGLLAGSVASKGGLDAITVAAEAAGKTIENELIDRLDKLKKQSDEAGERMRDNFASIFSEAVLTNQRNARQELEEISKIAKNFDYSGAWATFWGYFDKLRGQGGLLGTLVKGMGDATRPGSGAQSFDESGMVIPGTGGVPLPSARPAGAPKPPISAAASLAQIREWMSILGPAATTTQQLNEKQAMLNKLVEDSGGKYGDLAKRAMEFYKVQAAGADLQIKVQNGAASATELYAQKQAELNLLVKTNKLTQDQANESLRAYAEKVIPEVVAQQAALKSSFPELTKLSADADNLRKNLDEQFSSALRGSTSDLIAMTRGTETLGQGLTNLGNKFLDAALNAIYLKGIIGPLSSLFSGGLSGLLGGSGAASSTLSPKSDSLLDSMFNARGNVFGPGGLMAFARGGIVNRPTIFPFAGGTGLMGEAGPEAIMPLARGPGGKLGVVANGTSAPVDMKVTFNIEGATGKEEIAGMIRHGMSIATAQAVAAARRSTPADLDLAHKLSL